MDTSVSLTQPNLRSRACPRHVRTESTVRKKTSARERYYLRLESYVEDLKSFFAEDAKQLVSITLHVNVMDLLMTQRAVAALLPQWQVVKECRYDPKRPLLVQRHAVEVAPDHHDFVIDYGRQYLTGPDNGRLAMDYYVDEDKKSKDSEVTFLVPARRYEWVRQLLPQVKKWSDDHHFLRKQAFTACGDFLKIKADSGWHDVVLPDNLRTALENQCVRLLARAPVYRANGVPLRRGIILHGKPGTGKTSIGRALARECGVTFILTTPGMLEEPADVRRVFKWGQRFAPSILFFEDFDLVAGSRYRESRREILGEFLSCLDGIDSGEGVIVIATTNDLNTIEPAVKDRPNRFDCVLEVPPFGAAECAVFIRNWMKDKRCEIDVDQLAERAAGLTGAQLQELCRSAVIEALNEQAAGLEVASDPQVRITTPHFEAALAKLQVKRRRKAGFVLHD